jgi:hypothetical protein
MYKYVTLKYQRIQLLKILNVFFRRKISSKIFSLKVKNTKIVGQATIHETKCRGGIDLE